MLIRCSALGKVREGGEGGVRITMGQGAKAVSNLLMEAVAGRNMSMTNRLMLGNANHRATVCTVKTKEETKRGQPGHRLEEECFGDNAKKKKKDNQNNIWSDTCSCGIKPMNLLSVLNYLGCK